MVFFVKVTAVGYSAAADLLTLLLKFILLGHGGNVCTMSPLFKLPTNFALYCDVCGAQRPVREKLKKCAAMIEELLKEREILKIFAKGKTSPVVECFCQNDKPSINFLLHNCNSEVAKLSLSFVKLSSWCQQIIITLLYSIYRHTFYCLSNVMQFE